VPFQPVILALVARIQKLRHLSLALMDTKSEIL